MTVAVFWPDVERGIAIVLGLMAFALFPGTVVHRIHGWRAWIVAATVMLLFGSMIAATWTHLGDSHIKWFRSPVLLVASVLALTYVISVRGWRIWMDPE